jgi:hypothetical protein
MKKRKGVPVTEVVDNEELVPVEREGDKPLSKTLSKPSMTRLGNWLQEKKLSSFQRVIRQEAGLFDSLVEHQRSLGKLRGVSDIVENDRLERQIKKRELERKLKSQSYLDQTEEQDYQIKIAEQKNRLNTLSSGPPKEKSNLEKLKDNLKQQLERTEIRDRYDRKKLIQKIKTDLSRQAEIDSLFKDVYNEHFHGKDLSAFTEEERRKYEDLEDLYKSISA